MRASTTHLVLAADAAIDLQLHTIYSDGTWMPEQLIDYLVSEQFGVAAITDHDRIDTVASLQRLAAEKGFPLLVAVEMSTSWRGEATDLLCYGFDPEQNELSELARDVARRQSENTREVYGNLRQKGYTFVDAQGSAKAGTGESGPSDELITILQKPSSQQPHELAALLKRHGYGSGETSVGQILDEAGFLWVTSELAAVVDAAHRSGAVCLIAHPGRGEGMTCYDVNLLDEIRQEVPIDGFEAYYPRHTPEQIAMYLAYAQKHDLLISSGSDSHGPDHKPIKYRAEMSRKLLERLGIQIK